MTADPFNTAALRRAVLAAWSSSPARFREDANAEEALAGGGYAGRVLVELAANAADAAREAGVPARIRVRLSGNELRVANTGSALTADGVAALSSLRASPGARRHFDARRAAGDWNHQAQRHLFNKFLGQLHHCLHTGLRYDEHLAFPPPLQLAA